MNQVILIGNICKDPELRKTQSGISTCTFTVAVEREQSKRDKENGTHTTDFITVVTWRNTAELCAKYLSKGRQVAVQGKWRNREYEKEGIKRYVSECIADEVKFLGAPPQRETRDDYPYPDD